MSTRREGERVFLNYEGVQVAYAWPEDGCVTVLYEDEVDSYPIEYEDWDEAWEALDEWFVGDWYEE